MDEDDSFSCWLSSTCVAFRGLTPRQRSRALSAMLEQLEAAELWEWQAALTGRLCRDLVGWLPLELAHKILGCLDTASLFRAASVSATWRRRVDSAAAIWRRRVEVLGGRAPAGEEAKDVREWKKVAAASHLWRERIRSGRAFSLRHVRGHIRAPAVFAAMDFDAGHFAAATVDSEIYL